MKHESAPYGVPNPSLSNVRDRRSPTGWRTVFLRLLFVKGVYFTVLSVALLLHPNYDESVAAEVRDTWFSKEGATWLASQQAGFARFFTTWDSAHYLFLSWFGYAKGVKSCALYPLWPSLIAVSSKVLKINPALASIILANAFSLVGLTLFRCVAGRRVGEKAADMALTLLMVFPGSLFQQFNYTEPLFFLLLMIVWSGIESRRYGAAAVAGFFLPMTRAVGILVLLPILCSAIADCRPVLPGRWNRPSRGLVGLASAVLLGWGAYLGLMWHWTGNAFEAFSAQANWHAHSISHLWNISHVVVSYFSPTSWHEFQGSTIDRCGFALLLTLLPQVRKLGNELLAWTFVLGIVPALSGTFVSFIRFESVVFPVFLVAGQVLANRPSPWPARSAFLVLGLLHMVLVWRFVGYRWAG